MAVVSISLPDQLLAQAERFMARRAFAGRSELARAAIVLDAGVAAVG
jgi:metal-responsive CopG/Arc/MetJ family transcriptional regulator